MSDVDRDDDRSGFDPAEPVSVVQLHSTDYAGGAETVARLNHRGLKAIGCVSQFLVATKTGSDPDIDQITWRSGPAGFIRIARQIEYQFGLQYLYSPQFRSVRHDFKGSPDVVHIHCLHGANNWADFQGVKSLARRFPTVLSLHDLFLMTGHCCFGLDCDRWKSGCGKCPDLQRYPALPNDGTHWNWNRKKRLFATTRLNLIAVSEWVKAQVQKSPILQTTPVSVVPNPIDLTLFSSGDKKQARLELNLPLDRPIVLLVANQLGSLLKGGRNGIDAVNQLIDLGVIVALVGTSCGDVAKELRTEYRDFGYVPPSERLASCYRAADVFVVPSLVETFGLVAAEAAACGTAVAGFAVGGLEEVLQAVSGIGVEAGNVNKLSSAIRHLLTHPEERDWRASQGSKAARTLYSPEVHSRACLEVYHKAIRRFKNRIDISKRTPAF